MYIRKSIATIQYKLNRLEIRERLGVMICLLLLPLLIWDLLLYETQNKLSITIEEKRLSAQQQAKINNIEIRRIENQLKNAQIKDWIKQYHILKQKIASYKRKVGNYKHQTLSEKKLVIMLNAIFDEMKQLTMVNFVSISSTDKQQRKNKAKLSNSLMNKYYKLHLRGGYFAIMSYLRKIEDLPWQIYWDEMSYQVDKYPIAKLELTFHAMSKEND